jgi:hypothetical protein
MIGLNPIMRFFASIISQTLNHRWRPFNSIEDCVKFLKFMDTALEDWVYTGIEVAENGEG